MVREEGRDTVYVDALTGETVAALTAGELGDNSRKGNLRTLRSEEGPPKPRLEIK